MNIFTLILENLLTVIASVVAVAAAFGYFKWSKATHREVERNSVYDFMESVEAGVNPPDDIPSSFSCSTTKTLVKGKEVEECEYEHDDFYVGFRTKNCIVQEIWY